MLSTYRICSRISLPSKNKRQEETAVLSVTVWFSAPFIKAKVGIRQNLISVPLVLSIMYGKEDVHV